MDHELHMSSGSHSLYLVPTGVSQLMRPRPKAWWSGPQPCSNSTCATLNHLALRWVFPGSSDEAPDASFLQPPRPPLEYCLLHKLLASWQRVWETSHYSPPVPHPPPSQSTSVPSAPSWGGWACPPSLALMGLWAPTHQQDGDQLLSGQGTKTGTRDKDRIAETLSSLDLFRLFNIQRNCDAKCAKLKPSTAAARRGQAWSTWGGVVSQKQRLPPPGVRGRGSGLRRRGPRASGRGQRPPSGLG